MTDLLLEAPPGFAAAVQEYCQLPTDVQHEICMKVMKFIGSKIAIVDIDDIPLTKHIKVTSPQVENSVLNSVTAITYVFRSSIRHKLSASDLANTLLKSPSWKELSVAIIQRHYTEHQESLTAEQFISIGRLVDLQWKVGMSMTSSNCRQLNMPYVAISIKVLDSTGEVIEKSFEMTLIEFKNFSRQMREIATTLQSV